MKHLTTIILFATFFASCSGQTDSETTKFTQEIPTKQNGEPTLFYKLTQQKVKQLHIDSLQIGYDSLQIRIWYDYSLINLRKLLILKRTNSIWTATENNMTVDWNAFELTETIKTQKIKTLTPKNGWDNFLSKLFALKVQTLPNMNDIPGLSDGWTDGVSFHVEVATKRIYRFYGYHLPDKFQEKYWQAKNMVDILKLVDTEFGFD